METMNVRLNLPYEYIRVLREEIENELGISGDNLSVNGKVKAVIEALTEINDPLGKTVLTDIFNLTADKNGGDYSSNSVTINILLSLVKKGDGTPKYASYKEFKYSVSSEICKMYPPCVEDNINIYLPEYIGKDIRIGWADKYSLIRVIGDNDCEVLESKNMHKQAGEIFYTVGFSLKENAQGLPDIMLDDFGEGFFEEHKGEFGDEPEYFYL